MDDDKKISSNKISAAKSLRFEKDERVSYAEICNLLKFCGIAKLHMQDKEMAFLCRLLCQYARKRVRRTLPVLNCIR